MEQSGRLKGRRVIVTGGGDGIGAAIVRRFLQEGARVVACDIAKGKLEAAHGGHEHLRLIEQDVTAAEAPDRLVSTTVAEFGGLDILVNNAAIARSVRFEDATDEDWDRHLDTNLKAVFRLCRRAIPELKKSDRARIINISSINALRSKPGLGIYSISKAGVASLTNVLALELGPLGITVNHIMPGATMTGMARRKFAEFPEYEEKLISETGLGRMADPDELAGAAFFLASDDSSFVSGHGLVVDGGTVGKL